MTSTFPVIFVENNIIFRNLINRKKNICFQIIFCKQMQKVHSNERLDFI